MPELPEMETYRSLLQGTIVGKMVTDVVISREKSINVPPAKFIQLVENEKILEVNRRGKQLIFYLKNGSCLLLHLMLGGWMFYGTEAEKPDRTVQIKLSFGENDLYFIGLRLGYLHLYSKKDIKEELADIGPEPLDINFSLNAFLERMQSKKGGLKATLLDQAFMAGIGNRYSDEIAWHAGLLPNRKINDLADNEKMKLFDSIRFILQQGINSGGYMEHSFSTRNKEVGGYQMYVHDREGEQCPRCQRPIVKEKTAGRKTYYCVECQH